MRTIQMSEERVAKKGHSSFVSEAHKIIKMQRSWGQV